MLVTQLIGRHAGAQVDLAFDAVVSGYRQGTVEVPPEWLSLVKKVAHRDDEPEEAEPIVAAVEVPGLIVATPVPKRRGGWPKGKPRGPKMQPDILVS
jgi:hypothetical protein